MSLLRRSMIGLDSPKTSKRTKRTGFEFVDEAIFLMFGIVVKILVLANVKNIV